MAILVTGSTGRIGSEVVRQLAATSTGVRALVRDAGKASLPGGVIAVAGDMTDVDSMRAALKGIRTLFLINAVVADELTQGLITLNLARDAGIERIVYFSVLMGDRFTDVPHFTGKYAIERMIEAEKIPATVLRPAYFMQNDGALKDAVMAGVYPMPIGDKGVAMVDARDIGELVALELLRRDRADVPLPPDMLPICGPDALTGSGIAAIWSGLLNREVGYGGDDLDAFEANVRHVMPSWAAYDMRTMVRAFQQHGMAAAPGSATAFGGDARP